MDLHKTEMKDFERMTAYYKKAVSNTKDMDKNCRWIYGLHPTDTMIQNYIESGHHYYAEQDGQIAVAVALLPFQTEDYRAVNWSQNLNDDEVLTVHILCVNPLLQKQGIGAQTVRKAIELAKALRLKAVRLDALHTNKPAQKMYERAGFQKCDVMNWFAPNLGYANFFLYEYPLV